MEATALREEENGLVVEGVSVLAVAAMEATALAVAAVVATALTVVAVEATAPTALVVEVVVKATWSWAPAIHPWCSSPFPFSPPFLPGGPQYPCVPPLPASSGVRGAESWWEQARVLFTQ